MSYPAAERDDLVETLHGHQVADPYRWLEDGDDPRTLAWTSAQDALYAAQAGTWPGRDRAARRIRELLAAGLVGVPVQRGERIFQMRRTAEQEHAVLVVRGEGPGQPRDGERVLIDPAAIDATGLTTLDAWQPSKEGDLLAYQLSVGGTEESVLHLLDVATGELVEPAIDRARYSPVAFLPGGRAYYYVRRLAPDVLPENEQQYHRRVWLHQVGTDPATDVEIFGAEHDLRSYFGVSVSRDGRWLLVSAATGTAPRNDLWIADLTTSEAAAPVLLPVVTGLDAQVSGAVGRDGRLYLATDLDAPRGRLMVTDPTTPGPQYWHELLAEDPEAVLEDYAICELDDDSATVDSAVDSAAEPPAAVLVASWTRHAVSEVSVHDLSGARLDGDLGRVPLPGLGTVGGLVERPEGGPLLWFGYTDHTTPQHIYRFDARDGSLTLEASPPGVVEVPDVVTEQMTYPSADGTTVRMFVIRRADASATTTSATTTSAAAAGPAPTILYGYGGFGVSLNPAYSASILAWVEAGGVYAIANLRGGSEEGEAWHRDGMLGNKQHVFDDFHAAATTLVTSGVTTAEQLCLSGGSNGGLLVGAALTQWPGDAAAVVCSAPLLDMVRYELFGLGSTWNVEYGSAEVPEQLEWLLSYSPYHRVVEGTAYPSALFTVFDGDSRVDVLHARKLCAALQHATSRTPGDAPVLLRLERDVGHGARSVSRSVDLSADTMAFSAQATGLRL
jgi:prolyl oligopeptidase